MPGIASAAGRQAWAALAACSSTTNIFHEPWIVDACAGLPEAAGLRLLLAWRERNDGAPGLAGLLPLQVRTVFKGRIRIATQNWEQRVRALGEPLVRPGYEGAFWAGALDLLDRRGGIGHYLRLSSLVADSPSTLALRALLAERGRRAYVTRTYARAFLHSTLGAADYAAANIRKKVLKEQRRLRSRLADQGELRFDRLAPSDDPHPWVDELFRLELTGWKGRDGVAAAADPATERAFRAIIAGAHALGRLDFHRMRVGDRVIALLANIEAGDRAFQLKIAHDEAYAAFSPGVLLEMAYLDHALDPRRPLRVDSCARAGHPMIERIWAERLPIVSLAVPFDRASSRLLCAALDAVRRRRAGRALPTEP